MENFTPISALIGGAMIGLSAVILMGGLGRIAGISGILGGIFSHSPTGSKNWRLAFILGLVVVPLAISMLWADGVTVNYKHDNKLFIILAGILVGLGTQLGNGCTSGHGVCGNARFSERSFVATLTFMATGIATVFVSIYLGLYI